MEHEDFRATPEAKMLISELADKIQSIENAHEFFRRMLYGLIIGSVGSVMTFGIWLGTNQAMVSHVHEQFDNVEAKHSQIETRLGQLEINNSELKTRLNSIDSTLQEIKVSISRLR